MIVPVSVDFEISGALRVHRHRSIDPGVHAWQAAARNRDALSSRRAHVHLLSRCLTRLQVSRIDAALTVVSLCFISSFRRFELGSACKRLHIMVLARIVDLSRDDVGVVEVVSRVVFFNRSAQVIGIAPYLRGLIRFHEAVHFVRGLHEVAVVFLMGILQVRNLIQLFGAE